ncbi:MAG: CAP domain-containing protein [Myxococcota bacterium]
MRKIGWAIGSYLILGCSSAIDDVPQFGNGGSSSATGGSANGGSLNAAGGAASGGASSGGMSNGGSVSAMGGTSAGSAAGGAASGGSKANGGANNASGGKASGGMSSSGGTSATSGGASNGGSGGGGRTNPLTQEQIDAFVKAHNDARSGNLNPPPSPPLPPVTWDPILADVAYNYLSKCQGSSLADHNANRTKDYQSLGGSGYVGENIYASSSSKSATPANALSSWMSEAEDFNYDNPNLSAAGHYTQVVWRTSVRIGCAIVNCPSLRYPNNILCDYAPGGNINGQKPY